MSMLSLSLCLPAPVSEKLFTSLFN